MSDHRSGSVRRVLRRVTSISAAAMLAVALVPATVAAAAPITFALMSHGCYVTGTSLGGPLTVSVKTPDGLLKGKESGIVVAGDHTWSGNKCFADGIEPGDRITGTYASTTRTFTVPPLDVVANRVTNVLSGYGPKASTLQVELAKCDVADNNCSFAGATMIATDSTGAFNRTYAAEDPRGGDYFYVTWTSANNDAVRQYAIVPFVQVWIGRSVMEGYGKPDALETATLKTGSGVLRGKAKAVASHVQRILFGSFHTSTGAAAYARATDKVTSTTGSDSSFTVPTLTSNPDPATDTVSGTCLPNRTVMVIGTDLTYSRTPSYVYAYTTSAADGTFSVDLSAVNGFDLTGGDQVDISCSTAAGDVISKRKIAS
jgi:hypothetical protein